MPVGTGLGRSGAIASPPPRRPGSVEWLIVEFDHVDGSPIEATRASLDNLVTRGLGRGALGVTEERPARVGIIGCGNVTHLYLPGRATFPSVELAACADLDREPGVSTRTTGRLLAPRPSRRCSADPSIEVVLVLTPPAAHVAVSLADDRRGQARVLGEAVGDITGTMLAAFWTSARAAGVRVGAAPDTFLGGGLQTAQGPYRRGSDRGADRRDGGGGPPRTGGMAPGPGHLLRRGRWPSP